jgi:hypothetical protein
LGDRDLREATNLTASVAYKVRVKMTRVRVSGAKLVAFDARKLTRDPRESPLGELDQVAIKRCLIPRLPVKGLNDLSVRERPRLTL